MQSLEHWSAGVCLRICWTLHACVRVRVHTCPMAPAVPGVWAWPKATAACWGSTRHTARQQPPTCSHALYMNGHASYMNGHASYMNGHALYMNGHASFVHEWPCIVHE